MYLHHFGLRERPFNLTPDTQFYCDLPTHREALNVLLIALQNGEGFIKITGPVGTGKTLLCRKLLNEIPEQFITAYIPNPHLTSAGLHRAIADELGIKSPRNVGQSRTLTDINETLIGHAAHNKKTVLIIDEAQALPLETLEALRLLTNLETEKQKLLQIVLFGQPELDSVLRKKAIRQLRQRITFSYRLQPLDKVYVAAYVAHRLAIAGNNQPALFSAAANRLLHHYSQGIPRLINILAHKALMAGYGKGLRRIGPWQIQAAAYDTDDTRHAAQQLVIQYAILLLSLTALCLISVYAPVLFR